MGFSTLYDCFKRSEVTQNVINVNKKLKLKLLKEDDNHKEIKLTDIKKIFVIQGRLLQEI